MEDVVDVSPFAFLAGALCLDFANTAFREDGVPVWETLNDFGDLLAWGAEADILTEADVEGWRVAMQEREGEARAALERAIALREAIYRVFTSVAAGKLADATDFVALDHAQRDAFAHRRLVGDGKRFRWDWSRDGDVFDAVLWRVAESAAELLTVGELNRVRRCAGEDCTRLFLDTSRSGRRRWCDMSHCGNIAKVRRFRTRHAPTVGPRAESAE